MSSKKDVFLILREIKIKCQLNDINLNFSVYDKMKLIFHKKTKTEHEIKKSLRSNFKYYKNVI